MLIETHSFKANGLHLLFAFADDAPVRLLNFSFAKGAKPDPESKLTKWSRLVEVQANGRDWDDHHGNKYTGTNPAGELRYKSHREIKTPLGAKLEIVQEGGGLKVTSHMQVLGKLGALRSWTEVVNTGKEPVLLEYVSTAALPGASLGGDSTWDRKMRLHLADNTWYGECQWRSDSLANFENVDLGPNLGGLFKVCPKMAEIDPVCVSMKAGDCSFHNGLTAHGAGANMTRGRRIAMTCAYMPVGSTFNGQQNILPDTYFKSLQIGDVLANDEWNPRL